MRELLLRLRLMGRCKSFMLSPPSFIFFYFIVFVSKSKASPELSLRSCGDQKKSYYHLRLAYMWTHDCYRVYWSFAGKGDTCELGIHQLHIVIYFKKIALF